MAARKKTTNNGRSKSARTRSAPSAQRQLRRKRPAAAKTVKASGKGTGSAKSARSATAKKAKATQKSRTARAAAERRKEAQAKAARSAALKAKTKAKTSGRAAAAAESRAAAKGVGAKLQVKKPEAAKVQVVLAKPPGAGRAKPQAPGVAVEAKAVKPETSAQAAPKAAPPIAVAAAPVKAPANAKAKPAGVDEAQTTSKAAKPAGQRQGFKLNEFVVYPAHGVGQIVAIEEQEVAGFRLELFVISFAKDKMTLRVPTSKVTGVGMRKISDVDTARRSLEILSGRARIKRTMWSRRAQEYETKINSGDISAIAEVVRDLYRSEAQPEQSYSERQLYEAALDRMIREVAAVHKSSEIDALKAIEAQLQKTHLRAAKTSSPEVPDREIEEAA